MFDELYRRLQPPSAYKRSDTKFWDDEHISAQMLKAHLDPASEGASRPFDFIERSAKWISAVLPPAKYPYLLDLGCGPGSYAEKFCRSGYRVTGIDLSSRSLSYAEESARRRGLAIRYCCGDYLTCSFPDRADVCTMIYCDYGALSPKERAVLLKKVHRTLRKGGKFLLDVFTDAYYRAFAEYKRWEMFENGGFWSDERHIALSAAYKYPDLLILEQTIVLTESGIKNHLIWNSCFTTGKLREEAEKAGFFCCGIWSDVAGGRFSGSSPTLAMILEKR